MKSIAEEKIRRIRLLALGALSVCCVILAAVAVLLGREYRLLIAAALAASVNAIAVALSRMQREESESEERFL